VEVHLVVVAPELRDVGRVGVDQVAVGLFQRLHGVETRGLVLLAVVEDQLIDPR